MPVNKVIQFASIISKIVKTTNIRNIIKTLPMHALFSAIPSKIVELHIKNNPLLGNWPVADINMMDNSVHINAVQCTKSAIVIRTNRQWFKS